MIEVARLHPQKYFTQVRSGRKAPFHFKVYFDIKIIVLKSDYIGSQHQTPRGSDSFNQTLHLLMLKQTLHSAIQHHLAQETGGALRICCTL